MYAFSETGEGFPLTLMGVLPECSLNSCVTKAILWHSSWTVVTREKLIQREMGIASFAPLIRGKLFSYCGISLVK